jgi:hypothetical protein
LAQVACARALQHSISGEQNLDLLIYEKIGALPSGSLQAPWNALKCCAASLGGTVELKHKAGIPAPAIVS